MHTVASFFVLPACYLHLCISRAPQTQHIQQWTPNQFRRWLLSSWCLSQTLGLELRPPFLPNFITLPSISSLSPDLLLLLPQKILNLPDHLPCRPLSSGHHPPSPGPPQDSPNWCLHFHPQQPIWSWSASTPICKLCHHCSYNNISLLSGPACSDLCFLPAAPFLSCFSVWSVTRHFLS